MTKLSASCSGAITFGPGKANSVVQPASAASAPSSAARRDARGPRLGAPAEEAFEYTAGIAIIVAEFPP